MYATLKKLVGAFGVSGRENDVASVIEKEIAPYVDEIKRDALGNIIALKRGHGGKKVALCAHMDEIGFMATYIEDNGYIRIAPMGGINCVAAAFSEVVFENGVKGVLVLEDSCKPEDIDCAKMAVDIGASSAKEAARRVKIGDCLSLAHGVTRFGANRAFGRPLDNRLGCAVLIEAARKTGGSANDVYYVFSVQEEVGCRGAGPAAYSVDADVALNVDVCGTGDRLSCPPMAVKLGKGAAIKVRDRAVICSPEVTETLRGIAKERGIAYQNEITVGGSTDTSVLQSARAGAAVGAVSVPLRYIHSGVECVDLRDASAAAELVAEFAAH